MKKVVLFASGAGSNVKNIVAKLKGVDNVSVEAILTNNPRSGVIDFAEKENITCILFSREEFKEKELVHNLLSEINPDLIVLAGFLWLFPEFLIQEFDFKVINLHPALLPKYGGKGMYGNNVHKAVIAAKEKESGITIHYVNEKYDEGGTIAQYYCRLDPDDTDVSLAQKIKYLESTHFPVLIETLLTNGN